MKKLMTLLMVLISATAMGEVLNITCNPLDSVTVNRFQAQGVVVYDEDISFEEGNTTVVSFVFTTITSGNTRATFNAGINIPLSSKVIENMTVNPFLYTEGTLGKYSLRLLSNFPKSQDSRITDLETGETFRSNCEVSSLF